MLPELIAFSTSKGSTKYIFFCLPVPSPAVLVASTMCNHRCTPFNDGVYGHCEHLWRSNLVFIVDKCRLLSRCASRNDQGYYLSCEPILRGNLGFMPGILQTLVIPTVGGIYVCFFVLP